jgi:hypothetical protein
MEGIRLLLVGKYEGKDSFEERMIFKCIFKKEDLMLCSVLLWVRIETSGRLL